jgi:flagellin-like protein
MNRYRKNDKAVSPVIATILMVAITVVLAGVLVVYLQTLPQGGGGAENPVGLSVAKNAQGDWLISVASGGGQARTTVTMTVTNPDTGAVLNLAAAVGAVTTYKFTLDANGASTRLPNNAAAAANAVGEYNDNNANSKIDAGDSILLYHNDGVHNGINGLAGMKVQFLKGDSSIGTIKELPA